MVQGVGGYETAAAPKEITPARCPRCQSRHPHLHPAVQHEGEVEICTDDFHLTPTPQNTRAYIDGVLAKREARNTPASIPEEAQDK